LDWENRTEMGGFQKLIKQTIRNDDEQSSIEFDQSHGKGRQFTDFFVCCATYYFKEKSYH
jgi:hypothetical protein